MRSVSRGGQDVPGGQGRAAARRPLRVVGPEPVVQTAAANIGAIVAPSSTTDFIVLGLAIFSAALSACSAFRSEA